MENFDPIGGGFLIKRIVDFFSGASGGSGGDFSAVYSILAVFKIIFILFLALFICGIVYVIYELRKFRPKYKLVYRESTVPQKKIMKSHWGKIMERFNAGTESDWRLAIVEADSLVDEVFKKIGFAGETLGDRISSISEQEVHSVAELKSAHQVRNNLVHTPGYKLSREDADRTMRHYHKVLEELEMI
ncbi:hypothetical protein A2W48_01330 [Candidatus Giovannonibacteria bacterium RIFCSPHIGHO2_12_44_12]|uniref:Uncharacterized protein n=5 Tax=Candidatus Giovannoniibacteriota TaxID=1752738 RepID=A0A1F5WY61_9BACT|nr:MAG: hypothetical protein UW74_C0008G0003 [Candidatus Giovannonibacteria bacterium GW2011_GWC2_44_8]OGF73286.1 MAG: hypothetical protein A2W57_01030 [Candidatus Giovannonibacteria bacterium RIFCSPHIGHO2_02_43_16]OGF80559.1 MAG: hypothetical protein A2W48_01330 [Candidatus Giovannonibacteria bacterium RIFCSPHIGHO2_12_44_12]OGF84196.1 MAG: hypothetical protein A2Z63_03330 [Candidatus Giovannonibacteria bacterium RIFCSPLOWO2_02_44_8]OGF95753.1 MAG: hypothetical protein A2Y47_01300 [Candidatus G